jgi:hypothetical protein
MGKTYTNMYGDTPKAEVSENYDKDMICAANGNYCLKGCTYNQDNKCLKHEIKKKELKKENK